MSAQYDLYLQQHRANVYKGFEWIRENLPELLVNENSAEWQTEFAHDASKNEPDEYQAYDAYFYGGNRSYKVGEIILDMPCNYILEMICDWWAFSWQKGKLDEIFSWYDEHSEYMKLHPTTRKTIENILVKMKAKLGSNNDSLEEI